MERGGRDGATVWVWRWRKGRGLRRGLAGRVEGGRGGEGGSKWGVEKGKREGIRGRGGGDV